MQEQINGMGLFDDVGVGQIVRLFLKNCIHFLTANVKWLFFISMLST